MGTDTDPIHRNDSVMAAGGGRVQRAAQVRHRMGLHARPAADFVRLANTFTSEVHLKKGRRAVNSKSIMGILMLAAGSGCRVVVEAQGPDAEAAVKCLSEFLLAGDEEASARR